MLNRGLAPLLLLAVLTSADVRAEGGLPDDLKDFDFKPVTPKKDPKTGFVVGGNNDTALIRALTHLNGRSIAELEADMRPEKENITPHRSASGFLGRDERLIEVLAEDNRYVVEELGLTHQALARPLLVMCYVGSPDAVPRTFVYHGRQFEVLRKESKGIQESPFLDRTSTSGYVLVKNLRTGKAMDYSPLVPKMIERYGFYEGKGTNYRVEPRLVVEVFDFLLPKKDATPPAPTASDAPVHDGRPSVLWWIGILAAGLAVAAFAWLWLTRKRANAPTA